MATVTIKNVSSAAVYVRDLSDTLEAGETTSFSRSLGELTGMNALNGFINDGTLQMVSLVTTDAENFWATGGNPLSTSASPLTLYVATTGNDLNNGLSATSPLKTISAALAKVPLLVRAGEPVTINVAAGTYDEEIVAPAFILDDNINVVGAAMVETAPAQGITTGTFDAAFGTQAFPHRALVTGAGWAVGGLRGGFFVEILDGTLTGNLYPVINNDATTIDFGFICNTGTTNLQGRQFRLVKASTILTQSVSGKTTVNISGRVAGAATASTGAQAYLTFSKFEIRRAVSSAQAVRVANGAHVRFMSCALLDNAGGGGQIVSVTAGGSCRIDDVVAYRGASNNTIHFSLSNSGVLFTTRSGSFGGNTFLSAQPGSFLTFSSGFVSNADELGLSLQNLSATVTSFGFDACDIGVGVTNGSVVTLNSCTIKNSTAFGLAVGINSKNASSATYSHGTCTLFGTTIDACQVGVGLGANASCFMSTTSAITNSVTYGVNAASSLKCGGNTFATTTTTTMTGNATADFTIDGTATLSLAALRALSPKRSVDAAATFNRIVEV